MEVRQWQLTSVLLSHLCYEAYRNPPPQTPVPTPPLPRNPSQSAAACVAAHPMVSSVTDSPSPSWYLAVDPPPLAFVVPLPVSVASPSSNLHDTAIVLSLMRLHRLLSVMRPIESPADRSPSPLRLLIAIHVSSPQSGPRTSSTGGHKTRAAGGLPPDAFALHALLCAVVDILSAYCNGQRRWNLHTIFQAREERGLYNCHTEIARCMQE
uniref:Uncharacterized protein n=1 Tax=Oryza punctata TaxID=4537 RepID=A0A0E0KMI5_ORYPU